MDGVPSPRPISASDVRTILTNACPALGPAFAEGDQYIGEGEPRLTYVEIGAAARALGSLLDTGNALCLSDLFAEVERCLLEGDGEAVNLIVVGLLEDLQNGSVTGFDDYTVWEPYLRPVSTRAWKAVHDFWNGDFDAINRFEVHAARE